MPTYEFVCTECGNSVDVFHRVDEEPPATCEVCGGGLRKVFHPAGIVLRGSGFYKTDSRPGSGGKKAAAPKEQAKIDKKPDDKKPDKKPSEKKEKSA